MADISKFDDISKPQTYEDYIANNITEWEAESIARIARKIGKIGKMSKEEVENLDLDKEAQEEWKKIVAALAIATAANIRALPKTYKAEFNSWHEGNKYLYDYSGVNYIKIADNDKIKGIIDEYVKQNGNDIINLTNTKALCVLDKNGNAIHFKDVIYKSFGEAVNCVKSGEKDFYSAMRQTVRELGGSGCRVDYGGGVTRRLDTVVRQNVAYGIKQANNAYNEAIGKELNCDGYEVDAHNNPRPSHYFMQGKQYCIGKSKAINGIDFVGFEEIDPESPDGLSASKALNDYGCRHYKTPIICGVSEPRFSKKQLEQIEGENKRQYKVGDLEGNKYYFSQKMRALETEIRKAKDEINALKAFGNSEAEIKALRQRIKTVRAKYNEIAEITGISAEPKRMSVPK